MAKIHGNDPTGYNYGAADSLSSATTALAGAIRGQVAARNSAAATAKQEFRGYFSEAFSNNVDIGSRSAGRLAEALGSLAGFVGELRQAAREEDRRRADAKEWDKRQREREQNWLVGAGHEVASFLGFGDDPKPPKPGPEPHKTAEEVSVRGRDIPGAGGGSATSSAVPADLRSFQSTSRNLDSSLSGPITAFTRALTDYESGCNGRWGTLNARALVTAVNEWLRANQTDGDWSGAVAAQFEAAGGNGGVVTLSDASIAAALASAGIGVTRNDFKIGAYSAIGTPPTNGFADDPVNTATGNFLEPETDLPFAGAAAALRFTRMYNSLDPRVGSFGVGWASVLDVRLTLDDEGAVFVMDDGRQIHFPRRGEGWEQAVDENYWLTLDNDLPFAALSGHSAGVLTVQNQTGTRWVFTRAGTWLATASGPGTMVSVVRDEDARIIRLEHERGRGIAFEYAEDRVVSATASDGRRYEYLYDSERRLTGARDGVGMRSYRWNDAGLIDRVVSAAGVIECENTYDSAGRVVEQLTPFGRRVRFAYLQGRTTSVSDPDGTNTNTWIADEKGRVIGIIDTDGHRQSMAYDRRGNLVSVTERDGQVTVHGYDDRGRRVRTVTPEGGDLTFGYDTRDRVTTVVTASGGTVDYTYDGEWDRNPSRIVDPEGGVTLMEWSGAQLMRCTDPEGVAVDFEYDECGDLVATIDAAGNAARLTRDHTGRVVAALSPSGNHTRFRYDQAGLLIAREDADGAIWRFEHGVGGRIIATIDPLGARTELEYGAHGELVRTTDPLGRTITKSFDQLGNVSSVVLPDGAKWGFAHDALSRLRAITDPAGGTWTHEYDRTGEVAASVDPTGVRTEITRSRANGVSEITGAFGRTSIQTDEFGRPVRSEHPDGSAELITYDRCGRPIELVDAEGGLTRIRRDRAGRIIELISAAGRSTTYGYDVCGRPQSATDAAGERTTLRYDADSRVIERVSSDGEVTTVEYDRMGRVILERVPGAGSAHYEYDRLGRMVRVRDPRFGRRTFRYDAPGQLIAAVNGLGGVTRFDYDERGRVSRITDPLGAVTTRTYNGLDQVVSVTDPLGRVVTATYDAAGKQITQSESDGSVTEWRYDEAGRESGMIVDGRRISEIVHDARARKSTIVDHTGTGEPVTHLLTYNRRGRLIERATTDERGTRITRWGYDADGARTLLVSPDGARTEYSRDEAGRVSILTHSSFGSVRVGYTAAGRVAHTHADERVQSWVYADGFPVEHIRADAQGTVRTRIERDVEGRITGIDDAAGRTGYAYDDGCQLRSARAAGGASSTWEYDLNGRLVAETGIHGHRTFNYDAAGQLLTINEGTGRVTEFDYDGQGRRVRARSGAAVTEYHWDGRGWLTRVAERDADSALETTLRVNALGELTSVDGVHLDWDSAAGTPALLTLGDASVFQGPAGLTGLGGSWQTPSWRMNRATDAADPWSALADATRAGSEVAGVPAGIGFGVDGGLRIAGLEWMGARAYDPAARGFLSQDPLTAVTGAAWSANPYSYAGNDPLHALDPLGLAPVSDAELAGYANSLQGPLAKAAGEVGHWFQDNWEYVAGGAMVVAGGFLMATGVGGPVGMMLIGAGADTIIQKATTGEVNWGQVAVSGAFGAFGGGIVAAVGRHTIGNAVEGAIESTVSLAVSGQPITPSALVKSATSGAALSAMSGGVLSKLPTPKPRLAELTPTPTAHVPDPLHSPNFIVHPNGTTIIVPDGAVGPKPTDYGTGFQFTGGNGGKLLDPRVTEVRIMDPVTSGKFQYPNGYASYSNKIGQAVNPYTGQTISKTHPLWHLEL
ncbi:DUF6531 domain-containing protein [Mycetocola sp. JXN-3]|uniref:DUF6531 domain-containing protein n=1 Tax=Mycetocola sp. JXN-3 TaxID=2116510 RepID=UPI00165D29D0|nr:DUF6531 domain-containing protein [Mycetocola sp. JXN-3]